MPGQTRALRQITELARKYGVLRAKDLNTVQLSKGWLDTFSSDELRRCGPGVYTLRDEAVDEIALIARKYPRATLGLLSSLWLLGIVEARPAEDQWVIGPGAWMPTWTAGRARFYRSRNAAADVWSLARAGVPLRVHSPPHAAVDGVRFHVPGAELAVARGLALGAFDVGALTAKASELHCLRPVLAALEGAQAPGRELDPAAA